MAIQSRSRAPRNSGSQSVGKGKNNTNTQTSSTKQHASSHHHDRTIPNSDDLPSSPLTHDLEPPSKRRKLSIRSKQQTTLDSWTGSQSATLPPKPPTRVTVTQPHGRLVQNLNGVQTLLDADEDELSLPTSGRTTPKPKRIPKAAAIQPTSSETAKQDDRRSLRSHDEGPRLKSELSIYFPNYEEIIFDAPREPDFITVDSTIYITEDATKPKSEHSTPSKSGQTVRSSPSHARKTSVNGLQSANTPTRNSSNQYNGSPTLNLEIFARNVPDQPEDPLTDDHFLKSHRRAERKEKQLRNIEKERAMHEKVQLDRILEGLQGHDWLKVLGITGVTDGEAKKYESKRDYFIAEVQALVDKFKLWKEQERRQRVEKETVLVTREEESEEPESGESSAGPPSSDLNASAARQLQQETAIALKSLATSKGKESAVSSPNKPPATYAPPPPEVPITSFYEKRHLRDAALGKARHGRSVTAFGHPVPDMGEREFELPADYATKDAIRANAREKRRRKRETIANASS